MLKKFLTMVILSAFLFAGNSFCSASMPRNEMFLGGLTFGSPTAQILRMYGAPDKTEGGIEHLYSCRYGDSVKLSYNAHINKIFEVIVTENNGWTTPAGLSVGMTFDKAVELYGDADFAKFGNDKTVYIYFHSNGNVKDFGFMIVVDNATEKILRMEITGNNTMALFEDFFENRIDTLLETQE